jgi:DNA-binding transcriptional regulator YiaG
MTSFALQLKSEIGRLSRKAVRTETTALKKTAAQQRSDIAALKRRVAALETLVKRLAKGAPAPRKAAAAEPQEAGAALRFRAGGFASLRKKLEFSAHDMARLLGVSAQSVYHWETGKSRPRASQLQAIAAVRKLGKRAALARLAELDAA